MWDKEGVRDFVCSRLGAPGFFPALLVHALLHTKGTRVSCLLLTNTRHRLEGGMWERCLLSPSPYPYL